MDKRRSRRIKCNIVAVGELDSRIAHQAAAILNQRGIRATVTVDDGVKVLGDVFADEPLGTRQMIVVGRPALDALTAEAREFALFPPDLSKTDFVSAAGKSYEQTIRRTAESLALYDDSGAAGRRLLRELEDALDDAQGRDGAEVRSTRQPRTDIGRRRAQVPRGNRSWTVPKKARVHIELNPTRKRRRSSENRPPETPKAMRHKKRRGAGGGESGGAPSGTSVRPATRSYGHDSPPFSPTSPSYTASCPRG